MTKDEKWLLEEKYRGQETPEFRADCDRLAGGEPVSYVIGYQPFLGLKIYLESRPLIPRPETEWWTERLLAHVGRTTSHMRFLDLCAGSGAIGCAVLKTLSNAQVYFGEIDLAHKATIEKNIRENRLDISRANIGIGDLFEPFPDVRFDLIATNPPYIPEDRPLPLSVTRYEPAKALYAGEDGLAVIRRIAAELPHRLSRRGVMWLECDSVHAEVARELFTAQGFHAEIRTDQYHKPRIIVVSFS